MKEWRTIGEECGIREEPRRKVNWGSVAHNLLDDETKAEIIKLYQEEELLMSEIAERLNATRELPLTLTSNHVGRILEIANVRTRPRSVQGNRSVKTTCNNGHRIRGANLMTTNYNTKRRCRSCRLAHQWARRNGIPITDPQVKAYADERYNKYLLEDQTTPPPPHVEAIKPSGLPEYPHHFNSRPLRLPAPEVETCPLGHKLIEPNLVTKERRSCKSCRLARIWGQRRNKFNDDPTVIERAHANYQRIMGDS